MYNCKFYINELEQAICEDCKEDHEFKIVASTINWENEDLYCDECSENILSEYGDHEIAV